MIYRFIIVSDEVDDFRRDITIDSEATFFELHEAILDSVGYAKDQITSFFTCDEDWAKETEITLIDMDSSSEEDIYVMDGSRLSELLDEEKQKLIYVFEPLTERCFFMELREIIPGKSQDKPQVVKSVGIPPKQISLMEEMDFSIPATTVQTGSEEDDFYGEFDADDYNEEDLEELSEGNPFEY
ncbi:hypothetical protein FACS189421_04460 [Bacteroidia bacterium]|nr:hypothetical protein FACS189421_04460 [Bacteroidia bacterium]GHT51992.1 hypothetical protein FACS189440_21570 [Bacteroidia bacterium]